MLYVFIPYWLEDTPEFKKSLESQTFKDYRVIRRNRKQDKILWTRAVNDFWRESFRWCGAFDNDIVVIMNNDIQFDEYLFAELRNIKGVWAAEGIKLDWQNKKITYTHFDANTFLGHLFAMPLKDFQDSGGFCKLLPHALADLDFGLRQKSITFIFNGFHHPEHSYEPISNWSLRSYKNPIIWTIFLLRHPNKYTFINILKAWYDGLFR